MPATVQPSHAPPPQIPGFQIPNDEAHSLKQTVAELLERENLRFPGAQPVSFAREHVTELQRNEYFMCEKTDGCAASSSYTGGKDQLALSSL